MGLFDQLPPDQPSQIPVSPPVFTAEQVGVAIAAALSAQASGADPAEAATAALAQPNP
jgi:hypothetical protein